MGLLFRLLAPKPIKKLRRAAHPVSLLTPRPVRRAKMAVVDVTHPAGAVKRAGERALVRSVRGGSRSSYRAPSLTAYEREARRVARLQAFEDVRNLDEILVDLFHIHQETFSPATRPVVPEPDSVDDLAFHKVARKAALADIPWWHRSDRREAKVEAAATAENEVSAEEKRRETEQRQRQEVSDSGWERLMANEPTTVIATVNNAFNDNEHPARAMGVAGDHISIVMTVPPMEDLVPERQAELTPTGRPTTKARTRTARNLLYGAVLTSGLVATAKEAFAVAPRLNSAAIVVNLRDTESALFTPILAAELRRETVDRYADEENATTILEAADGFELNMKGRTSVLAPLALGDKPDLAAQLREVAKSLSLRLDPATGAN